MRNNNCLFDLISVLFVKPPYEFCENRICIMHCCLESKLAWCLFFLVMLVYHSEISYSSTIVEALVVYYILMSYCHLHSYFSL